MNICRFMSRIIIVVLFPIWLYGCVSFRQQYPDINIYAIDLSLPPLAHTSQNKELFFKINNFDVNLRYEHKNLIYKLNDHKYEIDYYNRLDMYLSDLFALQTQKWLAHAKQFSNIHFSLIEKNPDLILSGTVHEFYGDFVDKNNAKARINVEIKIFHKTPEDMTLIFQKIYFKNIALKETSIGHLIEGYRIGLEEIMQTLEFDLQNIVKTFPESI